MDPFFPSHWHADTASGAFFPEPSLAEHNLFYPDSVSAVSMPPGYETWYTPVDASQEQYFPMECQEPMREFIPVLPQRAASFVGNTANLPVSHGSDMYHEPSHESGHFNHARSDSFHSQFSQQDNIRTQSVGNGGNQAMHRHPSHDNGATQRPRRISIARNPMADPCSWTKEIDQEMAYNESYKTFHPATSDLVRNTPAPPIPGFSGSSTQVVRSLASPAASCNSSALSELSARRASPSSAAANQVESDGRARTDPLYSVRAGSDGNYHCPYITSECGHKPTKLKCNYEYVTPNPCDRRQADGFYSKYIDSHLKPFRCKHKNCNNNQFSSTACLLRHEREAHGLHGHGTKPFLCQFNDCERAIHDNGFPRNYNLLDHMKRVHGYRPDRSARSSPAPKQGAKSTSKVRKRKTEAPQMLRQRSGTANSTRKSILVKKEQSPEEHKQQLEHRLQTRVGRLHQEIQHMNDPQQVVSHLQQATQEIAGLQPASRFR